MHFLQQTIESIDSCASERMHNDGPVNSSVLLSSIQDVAENKTQLLGLQSQE